MANMSYCRFQNTLKDLQDCYANMDERDLSYDEVRARWRLIRLCQNIAEAFSYEGGEPMPTTEQFERGDWV